MVVMIRNIKQIRLLTSKSNNSIQQTKLAISNWIENTLMSSEATVTRSIFGYNEIKLILSQRRWCNINDSHSNNGMCARFEKFELFYNKKTRHCLDVKDNHRISEIIILITIVKHIRMFDFYLYRDTIPRRT